MRTAANELPRGIRMRGTKFQIDASSQATGRRLTATTDTFEAALAKRKELRAIVDGTAPAPVTGLKAGRKTLADANRLAEADWAGSRGEQTALINAATCLDFFGRTCPLADIDLEQVQAFVADMRKRGLAGGTINRKLAALSKMLGLAVEAKWLASKPKMRRQKESPPRHAELTRKEEDAVLAAYRERGWDAEADALIVLVDTGMRCGEFRRLTRDASRENEELGRHFYLSEHITKNGESRVIPMTNRVATIVDHLPAGGRLFPYRYAHLRRRWLVVMLALGLDERAGYSLHMLRHTCCTRLIRKGVPIKHVQRWMGHRTLAVTAGYTGVIKEDLARARDALEPDPAQSVPL